MHWHQIRAHPALRNLPFKIETDRWGHIVMSPASNRHSRLQSQLVRLLAGALAGGEAFVECSVATTQGVKVADVAWASAAFLARHGDADPYPEAPELLIEVLSPSNSEAEMTEKRGLYFARGAREVWLCDEDGNLRFFAPTGVLADSTLAPGFPPRVRLPFLARYRPTADLSMPTLQRTPFAKVAAVIPLFAAAAHALYDRLLSRGAADA